jgi:hypothetical protein
MQGVSAEAEQIMADLGFRGVDADNPGMEIIHRGRIENLWASISGTKTRRKPIARHDLTKRTRAQPELENESHSASEPVRGPSGLLNVRYALCRGDSTDPNESRKPNSTALSAGPAFAWRWAAAVDHEAAQRRWITA